MVDRAFLLLTFFMLTTTFARPHIMELNMPVKSREPTKVKASESLTIILGKNHRVHYFNGLKPAQEGQPAALHTTSFSPDGIRRVLRTRQHQQPGRLMPLIKASPEAKYQDILDETNNSHQRKYTLVKITQDDLSLLNNPTLLITSRL